MSAAGEAEDMVTINKLKSAVWLAIAKKVDAILINQGERLHGNDAPNFNATPRFIGSLTELVWQQLERAAEDVEAFAKHAGRSTVTSDDVLLLSRKDEWLEGELKNVLQTQRGT